MVPPMRKGVGVLAALLAISACSSTSEDAAPTGSALVLQLAEDAQAAGYEVQYDALSDGEVTPSEYQESIDRTRACLRDMGIDTTEPMLNPVDSLTLLFDFATSEDAVKATEGPTCQDEYQNLTEIAYLSTHQARMDAAFSALLKACVEAQGATIEGTPDRYREYVDAVGQENLDLLVGCATESARTINPNAPSLVLTY